MKEEATKKIAEDEKFIQWITKKPLYQPIPIKGLYVPSVRGAGCESRWRDISRILPRNKQQRILDIGCYLGYFGIMGSIAGHSVDGFDVDDEAIYWGNRVLEEYGIPNVKLWTASKNLLENLRAIPSGSYDYVLYLSLHHHMCSILGIEEANKIFWEISRIANNMIFDMGQSNEVDNGWLTWLKKIPQFEDHRVEIIEWILENSEFKHGSRIGHSYSHKAERWLCWLTRDAITTNLSPEIISVWAPDLNIRLGLKVQEYIWRETGSIGEMKSSTEEFPVMDLKSEMTKRYYKAVSTDIAQEYFICEYLYSWLSTNKNFEGAANTFVRGRELQKIESIRNRIIAPLFLEENFVVYPYCNWPQFYRIPRKEAWKFPDLVEQVLEVVDTIYNTIGLFDFNANNILFNYHTGDFRLIDFESVGPRFTEKLFKYRIDKFKEYMTP